ncbi:MAG: DUF3293 domain-containing protein [Actinomycetota bacterium]|nr:MAG: DUF3293 domain-containing protein [Actinomycetota bacterium]
MQFNGDLLETWKRSVLEIQHICRWITLWDGERYFPEAVPQEVEGQDLYIITAYNPGSEAISDEENDSRDRRLFARICALDSAGMFVSVGSSISGSHKEFGYAIYRVSKHDVDQLAREFGQIGYYKLTSTAMEVFALDQGGNYVKV